MRFRSRHYAARALIASTCAAWAACSVLSGCEKSQAPSNGATPAAAGSSAGDSPSAKAAGSDPEMAKEAAPADLPDLPTEEDFAEQVESEVPEGADLAAELDALQKEIGTTP